MTRRRSPDPNRNPVDVDVLLPPFAPEDPATDWLFRLRRLGIRPGLEGIHRFLDELGRPERRMRCVVVAGTNGKGTAATCLAALARSAGLKTGLYTSPHLLSVRERILVDGEPISVEALAARVERHRERAERLRTTFFETLTAMVLEYFADEGVELAVLEAGLGGRLDATNAVPKEAVILTSVGLDHQELLGHDLPSIAREKLGLAAPGVPFYLQPLGDELMELARTEILAVGGEPVELAACVDREGASMRERVTSSLRAEGRVQIEQAVAMAACYRDLARRHGWPLPRLEMAFVGLRAPCRFERYGREPLLRLDTAHNPQALEAVLGQWMEEGEREERILLLAAMRDKSLGRVLPLVARAAGTILLTAPRWYRALPPRRLRAPLQRAAMREGLPLRLLLPGSVRETLEAARIEAQALRESGRRPTVLATGSNFLVAEALDRLGVDDLRHPPGAPLWDGGLPLRQRTRDQGVMVS